MTASNSSATKDALLRLVVAKSELEVTRIIDEHEFFRTCTWDFYGDLPNNAGIIKAQSPDPVGALVEKITNGIDALLVRKCLEEGVDPTSEQAPVNQAEAMKRFFGDRVATFDINEQEVRQVARDSVRIFAEGDSESPTLSVVDYGEGQSPDSFADTFLSIGRSNKSKMHFLQGIYNQGGSAALKFCGNGYQLVLSRRAPSIANQVDDHWGFTLVRENYEVGSKAEQYEYCLVEENGRRFIPRIPYEKLNVLPNGEQLESGTLIRLYNYYLKNPHSFITGQRERELAREINKKYFSMPLPIELNELRTNLKGWSSSNEKTRIYGLWRLLNKQLGRSKKLVRAKLASKAELGVFGPRTIETIILSDQEDVGLSYRDQSEKVFLTVNGQSQHTESLNFLKTECQLPDLAQYMVVHVDLSNADYKANKIFQTARSGMISRPEYAELRERLTKAIRNDQNLIDLDKEYRERKLKNLQPEDKDLSRYIEKLIKNNASLIPYFQLGLDIQADKPEEGDNDFKPRYIPTILEIVGPPLKVIPSNRYGWVRLKTNAPNDYLIRAKERGSFLWTTSRSVQLTQYSLRDGTIPVRVDPSTASGIGDTEDIEFELRRPGMEPLKASVKTAIGEPEEPRNNPHGSKRKAKTSSLRLPERKYIPKERWDDKNWDGSDIGEVDQSHDVITVYINKEPDVLAEFPIKNPRYRSADMTASVKRKFYATVYLYALAMHMEMGKDPETKDNRGWVIPATLKAISQCALDLAFAPERNRHLDD